MSHLLPYIIPGLEHPGAIKGGSTYTWVGSGDSAFDLVMAKAGSWYDAYDLSAAGQTIANRAPSPAHGDTLQRGSTAGVDTNDPTFVEVSGPTRAHVSFDGSDDLLQCPASDTPTFTATSGSFTYVVLYKRLNNAATEGLFSSESASTKGVLLDLQPFANRSLRCRVGGTTSSVFVDVVTPNTLDAWGVAALVCEDGSAFGWSNEEGSSASLDYSGVGTIVHGTPRIGSRAFSVANVNASHTASHILFPGVALTTDELTEIATTLLAETY